MNEFVERRLDCYQGFSLHKRKAHEGFSGGWSVEVYNSRPTWCHGKGWGSTLKEAIENAEDDYRKRNERWGKE